VGATALGLGWQVPIIAAQHHSECGGSHHDCLPSCEGCGNPVGNRVVQPQSGDTDLCYFLADYGAQIRRTVTPLPNGADTRTESSNPALVDSLREHIISMSVHLQGHRLLGPDDPLLGELLRNRDEITVLHEPTPTGIRVVETSSDPHVVALIQAYARVVSLVIANGRTEMMKPHPVPSL
jgi:hypothetical protein